MNYYGVKKTLILYGYQLHIIIKIIMENVFAIMEERLAGIEDLLNTVLTRLDGLERPDEEVIGDLDDCARWIKKSTSTVYKYVSNKQIPHIKNGKRVLFNKKEIFAWLNSGTRRTLSDIRVEIDHDLHSLAKNRKRA